MKFKKYIIIWISICKKNRFNPENLSTTIPPYPVEKKGKKQVYIDYYSFNNNLIVYRHPILRIGSTLNYLGWSKLFNKIGLATVYY